MLQVFQNNLLLLVQKSVNSVICYFKELERCCSSATENLKDSMKLRSKNFYANETLIYKRKKQEYSKGLLFLFFFGQLVISFLVSLGFKMEKVTKTKICKGSVKKIVNLILHLYLNSQCIQSVLKQLNLYEIFNSHSYC